MGTLVVKAAWRFRPGERLQDEFCRVALDEVKRVRMLLTSGDLPEDDAIHQARRSFKKLRALVHLARPSLGSSYARENRRWRDAGRLLSASRDAAVLLGSFDKIAAQAKLSGRNAAALRKRLDATAPDVRRDRGDGEKFAEAMAVLDGAMRDIPSLRWPRDLGELGRGLRDSQSRLKRSWKAAKPDAGRDADSEALHDWRKRVKDASSHLGLFRAALPEEFKTNRKAAKELAQLLGEEHDLALLRNRMSEKPIPKYLSKSAAVVADAIAARRAELRGAAFEKGEALSRRSTKDFSNEVTARWSAAGSTGGPG